MSRLDRVINTTTQQIEQGMRTAGICSPKMLILSGGLPEASRKSPVPIFTGLVPLPDPSSALPEYDAGVLAPFAAVHYYRNASRALQQMIKKLCADNKRKKQDFRIFSNSRLPERSIAAAAGTGWVGRNGLLMNRTYGSSFIIAGILLTGETAAAVIRENSGTSHIESLTPPENLYAECGSCRECIKQCPSGAIRPEGGVNTRRCLQALATSPELLPRFAAEKWGRRIYGCSVCQQVCPVNRGRAYTAQPLSEEQEFPSLKNLLQQLTPSPGKTWESIHLKNIFPGTALEAGWIPRDTIVRNILTVAGSSGNRGYLPLLKKIQKQSLPAIVAETLKQTIILLEG